MSSSASSSSASFRARSRLLDAARGILNHPDDSTPADRAPLPCFALQAHHVSEPLVAASPQEFHARLCDLIRNAKRRVSLASLYIGPAASPKEHPRELELLQALSQVPSHVDVQIVMDSNRGLRQVPLVGGNDKKQSTSAAEAVAKAIHAQSNHQLYLCQVLPNPLDQMLPNPLNEVAGVFHLKAYVIDDTLILSGANLSEEYFVDRHDRYLQILQGGGGVVDFYAKLIDILCQDASDLYQAQEGLLDEDSESASTKSTTTRTTTIKRRPLQPFWDHINELFADHHPAATTSSSSTTNVGQSLLQDPKTVAVCVPTFHHPQITPPALLASSNPTSQSSSRPHMPSDVEITLNLLKAAAATRTTLSHGNENSNDPSKKKKTMVHLSSAYLNPSLELLEALAGFDNVDFLTAGRLSHGFRPKKKAGNKGKDWIPTVFDHLQYQALLGLSSSSSTMAPTTTLWHWQRPDWTFHAKGLWILEANNDDNNELAAAVVGSSNFGRRSFERDMESNLILIFPPQSAFANVFTDEWNSLLGDSQQVQDPKQVLVDLAPPLPFYVRVCFPFIKSFF